MKEGQIRRKFRREIRYVFFHLKYNKSRLTSWLRWPREPPSTRRGKIIRMLVQDQQEWSLWRVPMAVSGYFRQVVVGVLEYLPNSGKWGCKNSNRICPCPLSPRLAHIPVQELSILLADSINSWSLCGVFFLSACDSRILLMPWHVNGTRQVTRQV